MSEAAASPVSSFLERAVGDDGIIETDFLARELHITKIELGAAIGLSKDAVSKTTRLKAAGQVGVKLPSLPAAATTWMR